MPALPPAPNVLRVILRYTFSSDTDVINRFFFRYTGAAPSNAELTTWANLIGTQWASKLAPLATADVTLTQVEVTDLTTSSSAQAVVTVSHPGSNTGGQLAAGTATLMNYGVQRRYRGGKPRSYLPYGAEADVLNGQQWVASWPTTVLTAYFAFLNAINAAPPGGTTIAAQVNVSYYHPEPGFVPSFPGEDVPSVIRPTAVIDDITSTTVSQTFASQRRRQRA